ncbi:MAG: cytidylyltransferase domain-containing protein [Solirubrobacterales bacterium]
MSTLGFVQARMGSTRLPGKVLAPLAGRALLEHVLERVARTPGLDGVALLSTDAPEDEPLRRLGAQLGVPVVAGSREDVLDRFHLGAHQLGAKVILRVTADCPLVDPEVLGELLSMFRASPADHAAVATGAMAARSGLWRYPDGLDGEVFSATTLALAWEQSRDPYEREHVTPFLWRRPERFRLALLHAPEDLGDERWTVDHAADLAFVQAVYDRLAEREAFGYRDVLDVLARVPALRDLNTRERDRAVPIR